MEVLVDAEISHQPNAEVAHPSGLSDVSVIVLDDNDFDQNKIRRLLKSVGIANDICHASSIPEFEKSLQRRSFDFALIDFNLPDGSGLDALQVLKSQPEGRFVLPIMVAGEARTDVAVEAMKSGCKDYLAKHDLSPDRLRDAMTDALRRNYGRKEEQRQIYAQVQVLMQLVNEVAISSLRPRLAEMLRLIRRTRVTDSEKVRTENFRKLDEGCLELHRYCREFAKDVAARANHLH